MTWIPQALSYGYTAAEIIKWIIGKDKKNAPFIQKAQAAGYSPEEIVNWLAGQSGQGKKSIPQTPMQQQFASREAQTSLPDVALQGTIQAAPKLIAGGIAARGLAPLASTVTDMIGDYLGSKINQPAVPTQANGNIQTATTPQTQNQPATTPLSTESESPFGLTQFKNVGKMNLGDIAQAVAGTFGFRNKPLVNAVSAAVSATGLTVNDIYNKVKDKDISTPEKAQKTIKQILEENKFLDEQEKLDKEGKFKPSEKSKDSLQADLKSSVIRFTDYNASDSIAKVVFNNGHTYIYKDVPLESYQKMVSGQTPAKTSGENQWGMWWVGKNPSLGAAFNEHIKKPGFAYKRIGDTPFEKEEYLEEAQQAKEAFKGYISEEVKTKKASSSIKSKKVKTEDLAQQLKERKAELVKDAEKIRSTTGEDRKRALRKNIVDRLAVIRDEETLRKSKKKSKGTSEKISGKEALRKILPLLPMKTIKDVKKQYDTMNEKEALELVLTLLK